MIGCPVGRVAGHQIHLLPHLQQCLPTAWQVCNLSSVCFSSTCMSAKFEISSSPAVTTEHVEINLEQDNLPNVLHFSLFVNSNLCGHHNLLNED